jgi:hypothetical protein
MKAALTVFFILSFLTLKGQFKAPYGKPISWSHSYEVGGINPVIGINLEHYPLRYKNSYLALKAGVGYMFTGYSDATLPHSLTWCFKLKQKSKKCYPELNYQSYQIEVGLGGVYFIGATDKRFYRWSPIIGVRRKFKNDYQEKTYWKVYCTPYIANRVFPIIGVGIGIVWK